MADEQQNNNMQVISFGLPRTGTYSLKMALEELLHGKCFHMASVFENRSLLKFWDKTADNNGATKEDWNWLFNGFVACCDAPCCHYYESLIKCYPNAKFLMTTRDPTKWYTSFHNTVGSHLRMRTFNYFPGNIFYQFMGLKHFNRIVSKGISMDIGTTDWDNEVIMTQAFVDRNEKVKKLFPPGKLLIYDVREGWEPLCKFLDLPVPETPFPNTNNTDDFQARIKHLLHMSYLVLFVITSLSSAAIGLFYKYYWSRPNVFRNFFINRKS